MSKDFLVLAGLFAVFYALLGAMSMFVSEQRREAAGASLTLLWRVAVLFCLLSIAAKIS